MKKEALVLFFLFYAVLIGSAWGDLTLNNEITNDPFGDIMNRINGVTCIFFTVITYLGSSICAIVIIYAGLKYMSAQDGETAADARKMIIYALIGLVILLLACPIVDYLVIDTKIIPFGKKCNCVPGFSGGPDNPTDPPQAKCIDGTPPGACSFTPGYAGYKCILAGDRLVLALDTSCTSPPNPPEDSTTTTTTTSPTTTTTTLADRGICFNAENDGLCSGLEILRTGLKDDCCSEWSCCCTPATGACVAP
jgi:hypothetical protein